MTSLSVADDRILNMQLKHICKAFSKHQACNQALNFWLNNLFLPAQFCASVWYFLSKGVCSSVCPSRYRIVAKRIKLSSKFFHCLRAPTITFWFIETKRHYGNSDGINVNEKHFKLFVVVAWLSGSALVSISVVTLRWARLILGWVTVSG